MQHIGPRIYRSLEKQNGKDGFDTIVLAALESYLALREPNHRQTLDLSRLIVPAWDRISREVRLAIAGSLASCALLPAGLAEKLDAFRSDPEAFDAEGSSEEALPLEFPLPDIIVVRPVAIAQGDATPEHLVNADTVRETLRRLAQPGLAAARPLAAADTILPRSIADILEVARSPEPDLAYDAICRWMRLVPQQAEAMAGDATGLVLTRILRACRAAEADVLSLVVLLKPAVSLDFAAFEAVKQHFRELDVDACRTALGLPSVLPQMALPERRRSDRSATVRASEEAPRLAFGRRSVPPTTGTIGGRRA